MKGTGRTPEPAPAVREGGEGGATAPVPFHRAHEWLRSSNEYGAAFSRLRAHVENSYVRASAPSPKEAEALVDRVIAECKAGRASRDAEVGAYERFVEWADSHPYLGEDTKRRIASLRRELSGNGKA
jgi:hypothetical protein